ncbi:META domain-containing protein [uncultured Lacinutrix sp.]|uniref:META domain-containing protein n=1 Tax=uncultured Lacinutrix sp. TaxID=574032 RepID=UPI002612073C|nr:META domain-containing protein [uncultured Lacinutrix sp.]
MKTTAILLFAIILNACGTSSQATSNLSNDNMKSVQETLNGTFTVSEMEVENLIKDLTITFDEANSKVSGFSGCNNFFGNYTTEGNTIKFSALASTKKMCADKNSNLVESKMMAALGEVTSFEIKEDQLILLNSKTKLLTATKTVSVAQSNLKIEYKAHSRGAFSQIILDNKTVSVKNSRTTEPNVKTCSTEDWNAILEQVSELNLKALPTLEAPSKAHQYDGAALANFSVTKDGETYSVPTFDAGNPNEEIKSLYNLVMKISNPTKEKN